MPDNTADPAFDADALSALFNKAKAQGGEFTFAFGLASKPEESALIAHLRKPGKALKQEVKSLPGKIGKTCFGTFTVAEAEVRFLPERPAKGMIKALKKRFRDAGMAKFKPVLVGPDGMEVDEESLPDDDGADEDDAMGVAATVGEDAGGEDAGGEDAGGEEPAQDLTDLKRRLAGLVPRVQALPPEIAEKLRQACLIANQHIGAGDAGAAVKAMDQIEAVLNRMAPAGPGQAAPEPPQAPLARLQEALGKLVERVRALPDGDARTMLGTGARDIMALIRDGAVERAISGLKVLSQDLLAAEKIGGAEAGAGAGAVDAMAIWRDAKESCDTGISALQAAIKGFDDPDLQRIGEMGLNGVTEGVQTGLMAALFNYQQSAGADRAKAAALVAAKAAEARKLLDADPIIALCEDNPFGVKVDIRGTLGAALTELERLGKAA